MEELLFSIVAVLAATMMMVFFVLRRTKNIIILTVSIYALSYVSAYMVTNIMRIFS